MTPLDRKDQIGEFESLTFVQNKKYKTKLDDGDQFNQKQIEELRK